MNLCPNHYSRVQLDCKDPIVIYASLVVSFNSFSHLIRWESKHIFYAQGMDIGARKWENFAEGERMGRRKKWFDQIHKSTKSKVGGGGRRAEGWMKSLRIWNFSTTDERAEERRNTPSLMVSIWNPKIVNESKEQTKTLQLHKEERKYPMSAWMMKLTIKATFHVVSWKQQEFG